MVIKADYNLLVKRAVKRIVPAVNRDAMTKKLMNTNICLAVQDNFTIVYITNGTNVIGIGVSKRNNNDQFDSTIGYNRALQRAVEAACKSFYPVSID